MALHISRTIAYTEYRKILFRRSYAYLKDGIRIYTQNALVIMHLRIY